MTQRIWDRIESARERWNVLRHPFYRRWTRGELGACELARYSGQYRHAVEAIAAASRAVADAAPENEELGRHALEERDHVALWDGFAHTVGGDADSAATPETTACARAWSAGPDVLEGLVKLYAIESGQPEIARIKRVGLLSHYGFADGDGTAYFRVHEHRDAAHAAQARELIEELAAETDTDRLVGAAEEAFRANWRLLDGI